METIVNPSDAAKLLKDELDLRKKRNPQYSLRAFSRHLGISPSQLSQLISGKRNFSTDILMKVSEKLHLSPEEERQLILQNTLSKTHITLEETEKRELQEDEFKLIADWYHFAILSLCKIRNAKADPFWIADRLGITHLDARGALERLLRLDLIEPGPHLKRKINPLHVKSDIPSRAIQAYHHKVLDMAQEKLKSVAVDRRDFSAMTFAADPEKLAAARKIIERQQDELVSFLQTPNAKTVYMISCQLFPLERTPHE